MGRTEDQKILKGKVTGKEKTDSNLRKNFLIGGEDVGLSGAQLTPFTGRIRRIRRKRRAKAKKEEKRLLKRCVNSIRSERQKSYGIRGRKKRTRETSQGANWCTSTGGQTGFF